MPKNEKRLYEAFKQKQEEELRKEKFRISEEDKIVVDLNKNTGIKFFSLIYNIFLKFIKLIFIVILFLLISLGFTILINPELNFKEILNIIQNNLHLYFI